MSNVQRNPVPLRVMPWHYCVILDVMCVAIRVDFCEGSGRLDVSKASYFSKPSLADTATSQVLAVY